METYYIIEKMVHQKQHSSMGVGDERESLADYISLNNNIAEHLEYVVNYMCNRISFKKMLEHAKKLHGSTPKRCYEDKNVAAMLAQLKDNELSVIKNYMLALKSYLSGQGFEAVDSAADKLIGCKEIPSTLYAPPNSKFYRGKPGQTLADAREIV